MAEQQRDVIEILEHDHREVEEMFAELEALAGASDAGSRVRRRQRMRQVTIELVRHSVAEETEVYPAVEKKVSAEEAERAKQEHAEAEQTLQRLDGLDPSDPSFDEELATLTGEIREHIAEEEGEMFAHMRQTFSQEELLERGSKVESVKKIDPTRPHPSVPNEAGVRTALGPVAALFDRMRDAASGRGNYE
ncbi:MAG TPA: hemerythrin domain-containing protein [Acidimicrobiales bacterium]|nr:hemerythrin domain-containing protein [Acidimicrobiales bacterium]